MNNQTTNNLDLSVEVAPNIVNQVDLAPIERMGDAIIKAGQDNAAVVTAALENQAKAIAGGLAVLGAGQLAAANEDRAGFGDAIKSAGGVATAALAVLALYWALTRGRMPNVEVGQ